MFLSRKLASVLAVCVMLPGVALADTAIKFGTHATPNAVEIGRGIAPFLDTVEQETAGEVTFKRFLGGALGRNPTKQYELLQSGVQDMTMILPSYSAAQFPDFGIFALPHLFNTAEEGSVAAWRLFEQGHMTVPDDIHVVTIFINGNSAIHTTKAIASAEELAGLKIRVAGPDEAAVVERLGGVPVGMEIGKIAESMDRGVVDGALAGWAAMKAFRFDEVSKGHLVEPYGSRAFVLAMRKDVYESLSDDAKAVIAKNGGETLARAIGAANDMVEADLIKAAQADPETSVVQFGEDQREERAAILAPVTDGWVGEDEHNAANMKVLQGILSELRSN